MFLNIQIDLLILNTDDGQFTLTTKKSLHIIFKTLVNVLIICQAEAIWMLQPEYVTTFTCDEALSAPKKSFTFDTAVEITCQMPFLGVKIFQLVRVTFPEVLVFYCNCVSLVPFPRYSDLFVYSCNFFKSRVFGYPVEIHQVVWRQKS